MSQGQDEDGRPVPPEEEVSLGSAASRDVGIESAAPQPVVARATVPAGSDAPDWGGGSQEAQDDDVDVDVDDDGSLTDDAAENAWFGEDEDEDEALITVPMDTRFESTEATIESAAPVLEPAEGELEQALASPLTVPEDDSVPAQRPSSGISVTPAERSTPPQVSATSDAPDIAAAPLRRPPSSPTLSSATLSAIRASGRPSSAPFDPSTDGGAAASPELPPLPEVGAPHADGPFAPLADEAAKFWEQAIIGYEQEARALGEVPAAARIHLEIGRVYEEKLGRPRQAASAYQAAFNLDPNDSSTLHASRRLFSEVGNWAMVVQILGFEIDTATEASAKATLLAEKGAILEHELRDVEGARDAYEAALEAWPAEPLAIGALERLHLYNKEHEALLDVYERALSLESNAERRLPLLLAAGHVAEDRLDASDKAVALNELALEVDPAHPVALASLRRLHQHTGADDKLVDVLEKSAEVVEDDESAAQHFAAASRLAMAKLEDPERARDLLEKGRARAGGNMQLLRELAGLHRRTGDDASLVEVLRQSAALASNARDRAALMHRLGRALERSGDLEGAADSAQAALEADPDFAPAAQAFGRLLQALDRPQSLAALYEKELEAESDPGERVARWYKLAELRETRLDDVEGAIDALRALLEVDREYPPGRKRLEQLLLRKEAFEELVALHEEEVDLTADRELKVFLLGRVGALAEEKLGDRERAKRAMLRLLELSPKHLGAIRSLTRIAEAEGDATELLRLLEIEAEATDDQSEVLALMHRRATLLENELDDRAAASTVLEQVLSLNPTYLPALRSLGRLYGASERWTELLEMHRRELEVTQNVAHRVDLLFRIAQVREEHLQDFGGALVAYEQLLTESPDNGAAARGLAELYAREGQVEKLAELRLREAESLTSPDREAALVEVAELYEERLDRSDKAADLYQKVLKDGYSVDAVTRALVRIYSREGLWNALVGALSVAAERAREPRTEAAVLVRSAQIQADKLKNLDVAAELLERAVELLPNDRMVLEQLERVTVARRNWPRALSVGGALCVLETDPRALAARHIRLAAIEETHLDPPRSGAEHYRRALEAVPGHPVALRALENAYLAARDFRGLAAIHVHEAASAAASGAHRANLLVRGAELHAERLDEPEHASRLLDQALEADPSSLPALRARRRLAETAQDNTLALALLAREGEITADPHRACEVMFEAGRLRQDQVHDIDGAVEAYESVLERNASHLGAFNRLEAIYLEREDFASVRRLLARRADSVTSTEEKARLLVSAGRIAEERMGERAGAIAAYQGALRHEPKSAAALTRLAPLLMADRSWDEAVDIYQRTLAVSKEPGVQRESFKALGVIYQDHKLDLVKSVQSFQAALQADPSDTECLHRLAGLYRGVKDWGSAINVMLRLAEVEPEPAGKTAALQSLADLYLEGPGDQALAITALRKAVEIDPASKSGIMKLCELHEAREEWSELVEAAGAYVNLLGPNERSEAAPLHLRMADVFEQQLGDDTRAINALRYALESQPKNSEALEKLAHLYGKRVETYAEAIEAHRRLLALEPFRLASYHELHRMFERRGEHDRAFVAAEILVLLRAQTQEEYVYFHENKMFVADVADGSLTAEEHAAWIQHPNEQGSVRAVFEIFGAELGRLYPGQLERHELRRENKLGPRTQSPVRVMADELSATFGVSGYDLWLGSADDVHVHTENERPPAVIVGQRFAKRLPQKNQRFLLAAALERVKGGHLLLSVPDRELEALLWAVVKLAQPDQQVPIDSAGLDAAQRKLTRTVSSRSRRALEELGTALPRSAIDVVRHRAAAVMTQHRAGLVASNDIETAVRIVARGRPNVPSVFATTEDAVAALEPLPEVRDLLVYAVSEAYFEARQKLGFSVQLG